MADDPPASAQKEWTQEQIDTRNKEVSVWCLKRAIDFRKTLENQCIHNVVTLSVAKLDLELDRLLRSIIHGSPAAPDNLLFGHNRPLGTYSARCELCHAMRLIDDPTVRILRLYGKIRNHFAHNTEHITFDNSPQRDWLQEIENIVSHNDTSSLEGQSFRKLRENPYYRFIIPFDLILNMVFRLQIETPSFQPVFTASVLLDR